MGGPAEYFYEPRTVEDLVSCQALAIKEKLPITILGGGTNVLISDDGVKGLVIGLSKFTGLEVAQVEGGEFLVWALAGTTKSELLKTFLKQKLEPACFLAGLPGQVGGGVVMNAGVGEDIKPREFCEITRAVEVLKPDGTIKKYMASELEWSYRHCHGWQPGIITRVLLGWENQPHDDVTKRVKELNQLRLKKQPLEWPSCGSVFRNPLPKTAGRLIESVGLKGRSIGGAQVSEKHANFIINKGTATARDIAALMELCQKEVLEKAEVELHSEVVKLGKFN